MDLLVEGVLLKVFALNSWIIGLWLFYALGYFITHGLGNYTNIIIVVVVIIIIIGLTPELSAKVIINFRRAPIARTYAQMVTGSAVAEMLHPMLQFLSISEAIESLLLQAPTANRHNVYLTLLKKLTVRVQFSYCTNAMLRYKRRCSRIDLCFIMMPKTELKIIPNVGLL